MTRCDEADASAVVIEEARGLFSGVSWSGLVIARIGRMGPSVPLEFSEFDTPRRTAGPRAEHRPMVSRCRGSVTAFAVFRPTSLPGRLSSTTPLSSSCRGKPTAHREGYQHLAVGVRAVAGDGPTVPNYEGIQPTAVTLSLSVVSTGTP